MCGPRGQRAARADDADRLTPSHSFALAHPLDDITRAVWPQPMQRQMPSSGCSCKEGERSKWPWEASRATSSRLWSARAASMVARCPVVRDDNDVK